MISKVERLKSEFFVYDEPKEYKSVCGFKCFRIPSTLDWFLLLCARYKLKYKVKSTYNYEVNARSFNLSWCENDLTLAIKPKESRGKNDPSKIVKYKVKGLEKINDTKATN